MGEEFSRILTWPFGDLLFPENDTEESPEAAPVETGAVETVESVEAQSAQRRLAKLSKYFTTPSGVLDNPTGSTGIF